mgnify:CR=1 FL=1
MKEKTLYELIIDPRSRKSKILVAQPKHDDLEYIKCLQSGESDAEYTDEYRLISYDKNFLESKRDKLENKYKKKKFDKNHITYIIDESYSGSMYFKFKLDTCSKQVVVRLSDHAPNDICASLNIRYDRHNISNKNIVNLLEHTLDDLIKRKSYEDTKRALFKGKI